jgi:hypothetical protein
MPSVSITGGFGGVTTRCGLDVGAGPVCECPANILNHASAIEGGCDFLAGNRWKRERKEAIIGRRWILPARDGERDRRRQPYPTSIEALCYVRQPQNHPLMNKIG